MIDCEIFRVEPVHPEDPKSVHHPVPDRVRVDRLCRQTDEKHRDRNEGGRCAVPLHLHIRSILPGTPGTLSTISGIFFQYNFLVKDSGKRI